MINVVHDDMVAAAISLLEASAANIFSLDIQFSTFTPEKLDVMSRPIHEPDCPGGCPRDWYSLFDVAALSEDLPVAIRMSREYRSPIETVFASPWWKTEVLADAFYAYAERLGVDKDGQNVYTPPLKGFATMVNIRSVEGIEVHFRLFELALGAPNQLLTFLTQRNLRTFVSWDTYDLLFLGSIRMATPIPLDRRRPAPQPHQTVQLKNYIRRIPILNLYRLYDAWVEQGYGIVPKANSQMIMSLHLALYDQTQRVVGANLFRPVGFDYVVPVPTVQDPKALARVDFRDGMMAMVCHNSALDVLLALASDGGTVDFNTTPQALRQLYDFLHHSCFQDIPRARSYNFPMTCRDRDRSYARIEEARIHALVRISVALQKERKVARTGLLFTIPRESLLVLRERPGKALGVLDRRRPLDPANHWDKYGLPLYRDTLRPLVPDIDLGMNQLRSVSEGLRLLETMNSQSRRDNPLDGNHSGLRGLVPNNRFQVVIFPEAFPPKCRILSQCEPGSISPGSIRVIQPVLAHGIARSQLWAAEGLTPTQELVYQPGWGWMSYDSLLPDEIELKGIPSQIRGYYALPRNATNVDDVDHRIYNLPDWPNGYAFYPAVRPLPPYDEIILQPYSLQRYALREPSPTRPRSRSGSVTQEGSARAEGGAPRGQRSDPGRPHRSPP